MLRIPDQHSAAFPHGVVFRFMEAEAAKIANGPQRLSVVGAHNALCRILYHLQVVLSGNFHDGVHFTGHTGIMNRNNYARLIRNGSLDLRLIYVHQYPAEYHENKLCTGKYKAFAVR